MTVTIRLPTVLRRLAADETEVVVEATNVGDALGRLAQRHPQLGQQILDDAGAVRPFVRVFLDQDDVATRQGIETPLTGGETLRIVPAIAGG